LEYYNIINWYL